MKIFTMQCNFVRCLIFLSGILCVTSTMGNNSLDNSKSLPSTTSRKTANSLRNILSKERLVRVSMEQKMQKLVLDVMDNKHFISNVMKSLDDITKTLQTFEARHQERDEENSKLREELKIMRSAMCYTKTLTSDNIYSLNKTEISLSREENSSLQKDNHKQILENADNKTELDGIIETNKTINDSGCMQLKAEFKLIKENDLNSLKNATSLHEQKYESLSKKNDDIQKTLFKINETIFEEKNAEDFNTRLILNEGNFVSFSTFVNATIQRILEGQSNVYKQLMGISGKLQSPSIVSGIAFYAYMAQNTDKISGRRNLIFDVVRTNVGSGYRSGTGVFTVPETGLYVFTWTIRCNEKSSHSTQLMVNYDNLGVIHTFVSRFSDMAGTGIVVARVTIGDRVFVRTHLYWNSGIIVSNKAGRSSFAGWKIA
ncbi:uncharacterized protein LOC134281473 [Saccostrea cucullata]|uniref:uncharacterized protein LOC134281473 n=1 Tax=Saccostrea cuccullata TaxID=36930 RepID=UPI002ED4B22E